MRILGNGLVLCKPRNRLCRPNYSLTSFLPIEIVRNFSMSVSSVDEKRAAAVVCVTGAGGFIASWLVKLLLSNHHYTTVRGTLRNPDDEKHRHLKQLENSSGKLQLFKADLLDYDTLYEAISGCEGVFHVASPVPASSVPDPERQLIDPAVNGTLNVLKASSKAGVRKVVFVSSVAAVTMTPNPPKDWVFDENCWSDAEYCKNTNNWYCVSKTVAECEAWKYAQQTGLNLVTVCPSMVFGPMLHPSINSSSLALLKLLKGEIETVENRLRVIIDVRDVAEALILVYQKSEAEGRYLCTAHHIRVREVVEELRQMYPSYNYPKQFTDVGQDMRISSEKLQKLGFKFRSLEETLSDSVLSYQELGLLDKR